MPPNLFFRVPSLRPASSAGKAYLHRAKKKKCRFFSVYRFFFGRCSGDDQARDFRGKTPADVIGEQVDASEGEDSDEELHHVIRRTLAGGMDLAQDAVLAADEVCVLYVRVYVLYVHVLCMYFACFMCVCMCSMRCMVWAILCACVCCIACVSVRLRALLCFRAPVRASIAGGHGVVTLAVHAIYIYIRSRVSLDSRDAISIVVLTVPAIARQEQIGAFFVQV